MRYLTLSIMALALASCQSKTTTTQSTGTTTSAADSSLHIEGTWKLVSGQTIDKGKNTPNVYPKNQEMFKIINGSHFGFFVHQVHVAKDSSNHFDAGGGVYDLKGDQYTEHLDYYADKSIEGKSFTFTVTVQNDTLTQKGVEKNEEKHIERMVIEKYVRMK